MSARSAVQTAAANAAAELASPSAPPQGLTVLVCGDRHWLDGYLILRSLQAIPGVSRVIHGGCRGADLLGGWAARRLGIAVEVFPADWAGEGRAAGPLRNARMLSGGRPDLVLAFHDCLPESRGTRDMLVRAVAAGVRTRLVSHACPEGTTSLALAAPRDARRTRSEARSVIRAPLVGGEDGQDDRRYSVLEVTSGLADESRDGDQHHRTLIERQRRGRVHAAQAALKAHPEAQELVMRDQTRLRMFCARFGVTVQDLCPHAKSPSDPRGASSSTASCRRGSGRQSGRPF